MTIQTICVHHPLYVKLALLAAILNSVFVGFSFSAIERLRLQRRKAVAIAVASVGIALVSFVVGVFYLGQMLGRAEMYAIFARPTELSGPFPSLLQMWPYIVVPGAAVVFASLFAYRLDAKKAA